MSLGLSCYDSSSSGSDAENLKAGPPKKKQKVKILVLDQKHYSSDEDDSSAKTDTDTNLSKSGLFSKLPPPRNSIGGGKQTNRPLIPHVFSKRRQASVKETVVLSKQQADDSSSDEDDISNEGKSFFSYVSYPEVVHGGHYADENHANGNPVSVVEDLPANSDLTIDQTTSLPGHDIEHVSTLSAFHHNPKSACSNIWMQDEQFLRIQGKKNRNEKIEFIDINADSALEGNKELLLKSISEERNMNRTSHSKKKNKDMPSSQHKRKHQLPYLIHQAREREVELKNAWAAGKAARQAARNRYGF